MTAIKPTCTGCARPIEVGDELIGASDIGTWHRSCATIAPSMTTLEVKHMHAPTPRQRVLDKASQIIASDRNKSYGDPEDNLGRIAALWSTYLEKTVTARDVAWLMCLMKIAREMHAPHDDNPVDVAGYAAIAHEVKAA